MERRQSSFFFVGLFVTVLVLDTWFGSRRKCQRVLAPNPGGVDADAPNATAYRPPPYHNSSSQSPPELVVRRVEWSKFLPSGLLLPVRSPRGKYFREVSATIPHFDRRYYRPGAGLEQAVGENLRLLFQAWSRFAEAELEPQGISYWLAHGTLLGWYWGAHIMPWDDDLDVQMAIQDMYALVRYNMTLVAGRYQLELNPQFVNRWYEQDNVIDARFIDTQTGVFMDITALSFAGYQGNATIVACKSTFPVIHRYNLHRMLPLVQTTFEGVRAWVSNDYESHLSSEYQRSSLINLTYKNYRFNLQTLRWEGTAGHMVYIRNAGDSRRFPFGVRYFPKG